jgi:hypothetical protein
MVLDQTKTDARTSKKYGRYDKFVSVGNGVYLLNLCRIFYDGTTPIIVLISFRTNKPLTLKMRAAQLRWQNQRPEISEILADQLCGDVANIILEFEDVGDVFPSTEIVRK